MSLPSAISRVARPSIGRQLLLSSSSASSSSSSFPSTSSLLPSSRRPLSTSTSRDHEDRISVGSPSSSSYRPRTSSPRRMPSSSRPNPSPPLNSFPPSNRGKIIRARAQDKLVEGSFGLSAPLSSPTPYLAPTSLASVPQSPVLPRTLNLNLSTLAWFQTITPPNWNRLLRTLDPPTHFDYKRKVKYLRRALTKPLPAMRAAYLEHASKFLKRQDEEEALLRAGGNVRRIAGPTTTTEKSEEGFTKYVRVFNKSTRRKFSSAEWFLLSEEEKVAKRLEAREKLIEETPEGEEREELLRRLEVMDKGKEERARKKREEEEREGREGESS